MFLKAICILAVAVVVSSKHAHSSQYVHQYVSKPQAVYIDKLSYEGSNQSDHDHKNQIDNKEECDHQADKKIAHSSQYIHKHEGHHQLVYINKYDENQQNEYIEQNNHQHKQSDYHQKQQKTQSENHKHHEVAHSSQYVHRHDGIHEQLAFIHKNEEHSDHTDVGHKLYAANQYHETTHQKQGRDDHNTQKQQEVAHSWQTINRHDGPHQHVYILKKEHESKNNLNQQNKLDGDAQKHGEYSKISHLQHDGLSQQLHKNEFNIKEKQLGKEEHVHVDYYMHPKYEFEYKVDDYHTGNHKEQYEHRDGHKTNSDFSSHIEHIVPQKYSPRKQDC